MKIQWNKKMPANTACRLASPCEGGGVSSLAGAWVPHLGWGVPTLDEGYPTLAGRIPTMTGGTHLGRGGTYLGRVGGGVPTLAGEVPTLAGMGYPPPEQTHTCENITSRRTSYAGGNEIIHHDTQTWMQSNCFCNWRMIRYWFISPYMLILSF